MDDELCPKCGAVFPATGAWANRETKGVFFYQTLAELDTRVRCPRCQTIFDASGYRFFGFVRPRTMRRVIAMSVVLMVGLAVYFGFIDRPT